MERYLEIEQYGQVKRLEIRPGNYPFNRTLMVRLFENGESYGTLTCNLNGMPEQNCAFIDVNNMGEGIPEILEKYGLGKRTGRKCASGFVVYPEFRFREEVLGEITNTEYEQYLAWQEALKQDEEYISVCCRRCLKSFHFIVKKSEAQKYREYQDGAGYLIHDIFPDMSQGERGLFVIGRNMCRNCFNDMLLRTSDGKHGR